MKTLERVYKGDYIRGQFIRVTDPNEEVISKNPGSLDETHIRIPFSYEHMHEAVIAAKRSFASWKRLPVQDRYTALVRYRETLKSKKDVLAQMLSFEIGKPLWESNIEIERTLQLFDVFLSQGSQTSVETNIPDPLENCTGKVRYFPRGVMAVISPAVEPVFTSHAHLLPILLNGNTSVFKASKYAPFTGQLLAEIIHDSGLPVGVINVVQGNSEAARRLVMDPDIDGVFYTGSYETAEKIRKQLLGDFWKVQIYDTGGKNAAIIWSDCNYKKAVSETALSAFITSGQRCTNTSRVLVHSKIFDQFVTDFHALAKKIKVNYGLLTGTETPFMGPLVSEAAMEDYLRFQGIAVREGAEEIMRGKELDRETKGFFVSPSIHRVEKPDPKSVYQKSEVHGPNVAIYKINDLDEAISIVNQSQYGLVSSIYSGARENYMRLAEEARVGILQWNRPTTDVSYKLPYGGTKKSGNHRPMGAFSGIQCTYPVACLEGSVDELTQSMPTTFPGLEK